MILTKKWMNPKTLFWKNIADIMCVGKKIEQFPNEHFLDKLHSTYQEGVKQVADTLNEYYVGVGANLTLAVLPVSDLGIDDLDYCVDSTFRLLPISDVELCKTVQCLKGGSAAGMDGIPINFTKEN